MLEHKPSRCTSYAEKIYNGTDEDQDNESKIRFHISDQYFSTKNMIVKANIYSDNVYVWYLLDHEN